MTDDRFERLQRLAEQYAIERDAFEAKDRKINELHARIAELEIIAQYAGEDNAMAEQYAARIAEFTANYNDALKTIAAQARTINEMRELIYRASHLVDAAKKCGLQSRADLGEKHD